MFNRHEMDRGARHRGAHKVLRIGLGVLSASLVLTTTLARPLDARAEAASSAVSLRDLFYVPTGMELNTLAPAGARGSISPIYTAPSSRVLLSNDSLPAKYDLRDVQGEALVTPVKNQNPWGTCRAFGAVSSLESSLLMQGEGSGDPMSADYVDLSEHFLSRFGRMKLSLESFESIGAATQVGEGLTASSAVYGNIYDAQGYTLDAANFIMSVGGLPAEEEAPYRSQDGTIISWTDKLLGDTSCYSPNERWWLDEELVRDRANRVAGIKSAQELPGPYHAGYTENGELVLGSFDMAVVDQVKRSIMDGGAVTTFYFGDARPPEEGSSQTEYFNMDKWCQYTSEPEVSNHIVTVVGWDDAYPRENFPTAPEGDGAWIVKNSWGSKDGGPGNTSQWGLDGSGCFYLSYYDKSISSFNVLVADPDPDPEQIVQQYDLLGTIELYTDSLLSSDERSVANVFTAEQDMLIQGVSAYAGTTDMTVDIDIYLLGDTASEPDDGVLAAEQSEEMPLLGLYKFDLDEPVPVKEGQRYAVVQTIEGVLFDETGAEVSVWGCPVERGVSRSTSDALGLTLYADAVVNEGESFFGSDGDWVDVSAFNDDPEMAGDGITTYGNVDIKVFAEPADLPDDGSMQILHTNDIHGRYSVKGADGSALNAFSAVAGLAEDEGADLILDVGDTFHGTTFATTSEGAAISRLMDAAGYDATTPGNHDWSYGAERLAEIDADADLAVLAANVSRGDAGEALFESPYLLREVALADDEGNLTGRSITVGVLGVIDEGFYGSTAPDNVADVSFGGSVEAANETAAELREQGADVVVALTHSEDPLAFARASEGVDAVIAGHEHRAIDETVEGADGREVAVVEMPSSPSDDYFGSIGVLTLDLAGVGASGAADEALEVAGHRSERVGTADAARPNACIDGLTAELVSQSDASLKQVVGRSTKAYEYAPSSAAAPGGWELVRTEDTPIGHVVTGAYLAQTGADLAFENVGGIRGGIPAGDVTAGDILGVSPYGNALATYTMTGAEVIDAIERSLAISAECREVLEKQLAAVQAGEDPMQYEWPKDSGSVLAVGGADVTIDWSRPAGERVVGMKVGGAELSPDHVYTVALNSYLPGATNTYPSLAHAKLVHEYGTCEEALRALVAQPDWEQTMARISGSVTYVPDGDGPAGPSQPGGGAGGADEGGGAGTQGGTVDAGSGKRPASGGLAATGDPAALLMMLAGGAGVVAAGWGAVRRR